MVAAAQGHDSFELYVLAAVGILPLAARRLYPMAVLAIVTAVTAFVAVTYDSGWWPFGALIALYSVAAHSPRRPAFIAGAVSIVVLTLAAATEIDWAHWSALARLAEQAGTARGGLDPR